MKRKSSPLYLLLATAVLTGATALSLTNARSTVADETSASASSSEAVLSTEATTSTSSSTEPAASSSAESSQEETSASASPEAVTASSETNLLANIGTLQGESHLSPYEGKEVKISNVVVTKTDRYGFYVQDVTPDGNSKTSDAVYVVSKEKVQVGDRLTIEGQVKEGYMEEVSLRAGQKFNEPAGSLKVTLLVASKVSKDGTAALPAPVDIVGNMPQDLVDNDLANYRPDQEALDYWESIEAMLTFVKSPRVLGPQYRGDIYVLPSDYQALPLNNIGGLNLRPNAQNTATIPVYVGNKFIAKAKDYFNEDIQGVVSYRGRVYKLEPTNLPSLQDGGLQREASKLQPAEDKLTIASYNIENFSANASKNETPEEKVTKIANSFINEVHNPDIIILIEVQDDNGAVNDGTTSGIKSGEKLAARIKELGGVSYRYTEVAPLDGQDGGKPGANIRVAYLYNPDRVKLVDKPAGGSNEAAKFENGHLVKNPARIDPTNPAFAQVRKSLAAEFEFKGQPILVIANHLKSKLGDDAVYGSTQPAVQNTLAVRIEEAKILNQFVQEGLKQNPNMNFVLTGDFNDFEFSATSQAIAGDELVNLMLQHDSADRYSYFYRGSNQSLDNIFVSKNIADKVTFAPVHINASFMEEHGRASDHDPVVVQLDFSQAASPQNNSSNPSTDTSSQSDSSQQGQAPGNVDDSKKAQKGKILPLTGDRSTSYLFLALSLLLGAFLLKKKVKKA